jgi:hypothetical protein
MNDKLGGNNQPNHDTDSQQLPVSMVLGHAICSCRVGVNGMTRIS